jgi:hypothetical protein
MYPQMAQMRRGRGMDPQMAQIRIIFVWMEIGFGGKFSWIKEL